MALGKFCLSGRGTPKLYSLLIHRLPRLTLTSLFSRPHLLPQNRLNALDSQNKTSPNRSRHPGLLAPTAPLELFSQTHHCLPDNSPYERAPIGVHLSGKSCLVSQPKPCLVSPPARPSAPCSSARLPIRPLLDDRDLLEGCGGRRCSYQGRSMANMTLLAGLSLRFVAQCCTCVLTHRPPMLTPRSRPSLEVPPSLRGIQSSCCDIYRINPSYHVLSRFHCCL